MGVKEGDETQEKDVSGGKYSIGESMAQLDETHTVIIKPHHPAFPECWLSSALLPMNGLTEPHSGSWRQMVFMFPFSKGGS